MPKNVEKLSYNLIRMYAENFEYTDRNGIRKKGFNPPADATDVKRVPFYIKYITKNGVVEEGTVECISVDAFRKQRKIRYIESGEIRVVRDYLVVEIDGVKFKTL